ncbi:hypothetical protein [Streptomyces telluris]|uniref:Secreted protein n=1 Tax=Streptomyces telluris TaxID=2720021 RepID=A0A9X2RMW7_9ACTN|nr:hypothetical protein [Streptomyces telluris]MCQ8771269.1 hypothetical protein [Streptomyces telluris]NJP82241.1 hypothetical protein [Streptomyces telluris]
MHLRVGKNRRVALVISALLIAASGLTQGAASLAKAASPTPVGSPVKTAPAAMEACHGEGSVPLGAGWIHIRANTSVAGYPGYRQHYQGFVSNGGDATSIAVQVKGWEGSQLKWYGLGATDNKFEGFVSWGYSLATPEIRVLNTGFKVDPFVRFNC